MGRPLEYPVSTLIAAARGPVPWAGALGAAHGSPLEVDIGLGRKVPPKLLGSFPIMPVRKENAYNVELSSLDIHEKVQRRVRRSGNHRCNAATWRVACATAPAGATVSACTKRHCRARCGGLRARSGALRCGGAVHCGGEWHRAGQCAPLAPALRGAGGTGGPAPEAAAENRSEARRDGGARAGVRALPARTPPGVARTICARAPTGFCVVIPCGMVMAAV